MNAPAASGRGPVRALALSALVLLSGLAWPGLTPTAVADAPAVTRMAPYDDSLTDSACTKPTHCVAQAVADPELGTMAIGVATVVDLTAHSGGAIASVWIEYPMTEPASGLRIHVNGTLAGEREDAALYGSQGIFWVTAFARHSACDDCSQSLQAAQASASVFDVKFEVHNPAGEVPVGVVEVGITLRGYILMYPPSVYGAAAAQLAAEATLRQVRVEPLPLPLPPGPSPDVPRTAPFDNGYGSLPSTTNAEAGQIHLRAPATLTADAGLIARSVLRNPVQYLELTVTGRIDEGAWTTYGETDWQLDYVVSARLAICPECDRSVRTTVRTGSTPPGSPLQTTAVEPGEFSLTLLLRNPTGDPIPPSAIDVRAGLVSTSSFGGTATDVCTPYVLFFNQFCVFETGAMVNGEIQATITRVEGRVIADPNYLPDLAVTGFEQESWTVAGGDGVLLLTVQNVGTLPTPATWARVHTEPLEGGGDHEVNNQFWDNPRDHMLYIPALAGGEAYPIRFQPYTWGGFYEADVLLDSDGAIFERSEANNVGPVIQLSKCPPRSLGACAELIVTDIRITPANPRAGDIVSLEVEVKNIGPASTGRDHCCPDWVMWAASCSNGGYARTSPIEAGQTVTLPSCTFTAPEPGTYQLWAEVDPWRGYVDYWGGDIPEYDEFNNEFTKPFTVGPTDGTPQKPDVRITDRWDWEGVPVDLVVSLSWPSQSEIQIRYDTSSGTATEGLDFSSTSGTLIFAPGETSKSITIPTLQDSFAEPDETFTVSIDLSAGESDAIIRDPEGMGGIVDNDPVPAASVNDASASEGNAATFTVTLSNPSANAVDVQYTTSGGTATEGTDFSDATGTVRFAPGETTKTIVVPTTEDAMDEPDENFVLTISLGPGESDASVGDATGTGTILDDDASGSAGADLSPPSQAKTVPKGQTATYQLTVKNTGTAADTFQLATTGSKNGWSSSLSTSTVTLAAGASTTITLSTTAGNAGSLTVTVTATSQRDASVQDSATCKTTVAK